jgi:hypothetical protein
VVETYFTYSHTEGEVKTFTRITRIATRGISLCYTMSPTYKYFLNVEHMSGSIYIMDENNTT